MQEDLLPRDYQLEHEDRPTSRGHFDPEYQRIIHENKSKKETMYQEQQVKDRASRMEAIERLANTEDGSLFFKWLCTHLSFKGSILAMTHTGVIDKEALIFNEARRLIWIDINKQMSIGTRNKIEEDS